MEEPVPLPFIEKIYKNVIRCHLMSWERFSDRLVLEIELKKLQAPPFKKYIDPSIFHITPSRNLSSVWNIDFKRE